jgi:hypothetical protein
MIYYQPKHFQISEFIPKQIAEMKNIKPEWFLNPAIIWTADMIRERYKKPVFINTWMFSGKPYINYRGFRPSDCNVGAWLSQHKIGNAIDFNVDGVPSKEVQSDIIKNYDLDCFKYITCVEIEPALEKTHIDCRPYDKKTFGILILTKS